MRRTTLESCLVLFHVFLAAASLFANYELLRGTIFSDQKKKDPTFAAMCYTISATPRPVVVNNHAVVQEEPTKRRRRTKAMICGHHNKNVISVLKDDFNFTEVCWNSGGDWDIVYGGYPHCGKQDTGYRDWKMEFGLNKRLTEEGWSNLKPHQVWFPCMGCSNSYYEKNQLCEILREIDPSACFSLPEDTERLKAKMDGTKAWVLKRDGANLNLHVGSGVSYIKDYTELPEDLSDGSYLVQPYLEPFLGPGQYQRKAELKIYLAVTSVDPLRVYMYQRMWVQLAGSLYSTDINNRCVHDNHALINGACDEGLTEDQRQISFEDYASKTEMPIDLQENLLRDAKKLIAGIVQHANPQIKKHVVNDGIKKSGASCFSYMRADFGITEMGEPVLFEINEFPYTNSDSPIPKAIQQNSHHELFRMIGLDIPVIYGEDNRARYEAAHTGEWELLVPNDEMLM